MTSQRPTGEPVDDSVRETQGDPQARDLQFDTAHLRSDLSRRTVRGAALTLGSHTVRFLLETTRIIVLARLLSPVDYGLVAMVTVVTGLIAMFQDLGLQMPTLTRRRITHPEVSTLFWINVGVGVALVLVVIAVAPLLAWFYDEVRLVPIAIVLAPTFLIAGFTVQHQALLQRQMRFGALSTIAILSSAGGLAVGIPMAYSGAGYWALVGMSMTSVATNAGAVWVACGWRPGRPVRGVEVREMIRFGSHVTGTNLVGYLSRRLDHALVGWWWGAIPLGLYTKANSLVEAPMTRALSSMGSVTVPSLSSLADRPERYRGAYLRILTMLALALMPAAAFLVGTAQLLIPFLLGPRWVEAAPIFGALAVLTFVAPVDGSSLLLFLTQNRAREALRWSLVRGLLTGVAVVAGLPWGGLGVAAALAVSGLIRTPLLIWCVTRHGPVRAADIYRTLVTPALASILALVALLVLAPRAAGIAAAPALTGGLVVTGVVVLAVLAVVPSGRGALLDAWAALRLLRRQRDGQSGRP